MRQRIFPRAVAATCALLVWLWASSASAQTLRIFHIDVEQGDATLVVTPSGKTLLVDSGKNGHGKRLKAIMDAAGVTQIDAFVATHYHEDHYGGIDDLVNMGVPVLAAFDRGDKACCLSDKKKAEASFIGYQTAIGHRATHIQRGTRIELDPLVTVMCISSGGVVIGEAPHQHGHDENDMSVSLLVTFGGFRYFIGGDIESTTERKIAERDLVLDLDVYQANHHGSHTSSSPEFMADMQPTLVVVSNGSDGGYKHPRAVTLQAYAAMPGPPVVLQTNKCHHPEPCANVSDSFIADPVSKTVNGTITVTVDAATSTYTATWGTQTRTFNTKALPPVAPVPSVVIDSLLPDPVGNDEQLEEVTLLNTTDDTVSLAGWKLRDRSGFDWNLSGSIGPGESRTFRRNGQGMSLNNNGDEITLLDAVMTLQDRFAYTSSSEGLRISRTP